VAKEPPKFGLPGTLQPADLLHFVELDGFTDEWEHLGLDDDDLNKLQFALMEGGKHSPIVPGTGGLRKRLERFGLVLLITAYAKNEQSSLSARAKRMSRKLIETAEAELEARRRKRKFRGTNP
jgi:hypothetical protein